PADLRPLPVAGAEPRMWANTCWTTPRMRSSVTCMIRLGILSRLAGVEDGPVIDVDGVHDTDDGGVDGQLLGLGGEAGAGALDDQHHLALAGADRIDHHEVPPGADQLPPGLRVDAQGLDDEQLVPRHRGDLLRRDHAAADPGDEHGLTS